MQKALTQVDEKDPKAHLKKLSLISKITKLKKEGMQVPEVTKLAKKGMGIKKFRKADELYYLMKQIKKSKSKANSVVTLQEEILKVDLMIEG